MRTTSTKFLRHTRIAMRDDYHVSLLTITHPSLLPDLTIACDTLPITSNGVEYLGHPFSMDMFSDNGEPIKANLVVENTDYRIGYAIHQINTPLKVKWQLVLASQPNVIIMTMDHLLMKIITVDSSKVEGTLIFKNYSTTAWPGILANKKNAPGLWRGIG